VKLRGEVRDLKAQLAKNSTNSSNPPSTDLRGVERPNALPSGRKPGGQSTAGVCADLVKTRSEFGSRFVERVLSVVASLMQQDRNALDFLVAAIRSYRAGQQSSSLLPASMRRS